jgi:hypothetical protein
LELAVALALVEQQPDDVLLPMTLVLGSEFPEHLGVFSLILQEMQREH